MALNVDTVWEARTTGNNENGAGFRTGVGGTDYSQQDAPQLSLTDLTTAGAGATTITSVTGGFTSVMVGNLIRIRSGTNFTVGYYEIVTFTDANNVVLDRTPTPALAGTAGAGKVGGAAAHPQQFSAVVVAGNIVYIKSGTYTLSGSGLVFPVGSATLSKPTRIIGYGTTRDDGGTKPIIKNAALTNINVIRITAGGSIEHCVIDNIEVDGNTPAGWIRGISCEDLTIVKNCRVKNCSLGISSAQAVINCELSGWYFNGGITDEAALSACLFIYGCYLHDGSYHGIEVSGRTVIAHTVLDTITGAGSDGITSDGNFNAYIVNCSLYNIGRHGIYVDNAVPAFLYSIINTVATNCGGYGFKSAENIGSAILKNCAGYNNTSGNYVTAEWGEITNFKALTADPFNNAAGGDFSLNAASAGTTLKDAGFPGLLPGSSSTGYLDIGAIESACGGSDTGGGGGNPTITGEQMWFLTSDRKVERWQTSATTDDGTALPAWVYKTGMMQIGEKTYVRRILSQVEGATVTATVLNSPASGETGQAKTLATIEDEKRYPPHYKGYTWCIKLAGANTAAVTRLHIELAPVEGEGSERTT